MILPPLPLHNGCLIVDNSFLETVCDREKQFQFLNKRVSSAQRSALTFGSIIHTALEWRYRNIKNDEVGVFEQDEQDRVLKWQFENVQIPEGDWRTLDHAMELCRRYNQRYHLEPFNLMQYKEPVECQYCKGTGQRFAVASDPITENPPSNQVPCLMCAGTGKNDIMTELSFLVPLYESDQVPDYLKITKDKIPITHIPILYSGRIDLVVSWDNQIVIIDHKTASQLGESFESENHISPQYPGYAWGFEQSTGQKVDAFCINGIRTKQPAAKPKGGIDQWWEESFWRSGPDYIRPGQLDEWKRNAIELVEEFLWHYSRGYLPKKAKQHCVSKYGKCSFYDVCDLPLEQQADELASDKFKENDWSPLVKPSNETNRIT